MATSIGIREFRDHASDVLKRVERTGQPLEITRRGRTIARLVPADSEEDRRAAYERWRVGMQKVVDQIAAEWDGQPVDAVEMIRDQRREL